MEASTSANYLYFNTNTCSLRYILLTKKAGLKFNLIYIIFYFFIYHKIKQNKNVPRHSELFVCVLTVIHYKFSICHKNLVIFFSFLYKIIFTTFVMLILKKLIYSEWKNILKLTELLISLFIFRNEFEFDIFKIRKPVEIMRNCQSSM